MNFLNIREGNPSLLRKS